MKPLIINAALTGMVPTKSDTPHVPLTPEEIVRDAKRCRDAGATILHLHARDPGGEPTYRIEVYREILQGVREECPEVLISASCSGRTHKEFWQRSQVLELDPDLGSLTMGSMNFPQQPSINSPEIIRKLATAMMQRGIVPEMELFDLGMVDYAHFLISKGVLRPPFYANILLGSLGTLSATPDNLCTIVRALPAGTTWAAAGIGRYQFFVNSLAITMGGHVRVGLEDAIYFDWETRALATNAGLIERVVRLAHAAGRQVASAEQAREIVGMSKPQTLPLRIAA
jgi:uncharacterized protein (DUF849 family)